MAFGTGKIIAPHVNVTVSVGLKELPGQIRMFNRIPSTPIKMTGTAAGAA
jgi:hypothetical protein